MYVCMLVVGLELGDYVDVEVTTLEGKGLLGFMTG